MPSGTEMKILKGIKEKGGETNLFRVAKHIGMSTDYVKIVCRRLGMGDYLDMFRTGKIRLTPKGWKAVGGREVVPSEAEKDKKGGSSEVKKKKPETQQEKYERWISLDRKIA